MNRHLVAIRPHRCPDDSPLGTVTKTGDRSNIATDSWLCHSFSLAIGHKAAIASGPVR